MEPRDGGRHGHRPDGRQDADDDPDRHFVHEGALARLAGGDYLGTGRRVGHQRSVFPLDLAAAAQDDGEVLGFQSAQCGGQADGD